MFTIHEIQKKFPEAKPVWRGNGEGWTVNCWKYHKHGGLHEMEIGPTGVFHCHNCGHAGVLQQEFPEYFDPLSEIFPDLFIQREGDRSRGWRRRNQRDTARERLCVQVTL